MEQLSVHNDEKTNFPTLHFSLQEIKKKSRGKSLKSSETQGEGRKTGTWRIYISRVTF